MVISRVIDLNFFFNIDNQTRKPQKEPGNGHLDMNFKKIIGSKNNLWEITRVWRIRPF